MTFSHFPTHFSPIYEKLLEAGLIELLPPTTSPRKLSTSHNPSAYCAFHQCNDHSTNNCFRLQQKIQDLIDNGTIPPLQKPNTLPKHEQSHHINCINPNSTKNNLTSTIFDPSHYITPTTKPKPTINIPEVVGICTLKNMDRVWESTPDEWRLLGENYPLIFEKFKVGLAYDSVEHDPFGQLLSNQTIKGIFNGIKIHPHQCIINNWPPEPIVSISNTLDASIISSKPTQSLRVDQKPNDAQNSKEGHEPTKDQEEAFERVVATKNHECNKANP